MLIIMIKSIIFGIGGVIADTERIHCRSYLETLKRRNINISEQDYYDFWTRKGNDIKIL